MRPTSALAFQQSAVNVRRIALAAATIAAVPGLATAQPLNGLYVGVGAGANLLQNEHFVGSTGTAT